MKRFLVFLVLLGLFVAAALAGPAERFNKFDCVFVAATGNQLFVPSYNGAVFTPDKLEWIQYQTSGVDACTLTVYIPSSSGPASANDSVKILCLARSNDGGFVRTFYGTISDTIRIGTVDSDAGIIVNAYGY